MICFAWHGFPQYAARCVGAFVETTVERIVVVATRPHVPVEGMERLAGCEVIWIDGDDDSRDIVTLCGEVPRVLFVSGWGTPAYNRYRDRVRVRGGKVIALVDNDYRVSLRQIIKAVRFNFLLKRKYDGYLVAGESSRRLLRFYGVPDKRIRIGLYSADEALFTCSRPILERAKKILFVGQLDSRKNIVPFARAFLAANAQREWTLEICGCGPDKGMIPQDETIVVHDFIQPEELAGIYQTARVFALPSLEEHWGVVVHEAALSGCVLLLSDRIGAAADFLGERNGLVANPYSEAEMKDAVRRVMLMADEALDAAQRESLKLARQISKRLFVDEVKGFSRE